MKRFLLEEGIEGKREEGNTGSGEKGRREGTKEAIKRSGAGNKGDERKESVWWWGGGTTAAG